MKTTLDLPENLVREMKMKADRVQFPLVECKTATSADELSPSRVAEILTDQETEWSEEAS